MAMHDNRLKSILNFLKENPDGVTFQQIQRYLADNGYPKSRNVIEAAIAYLLGAKKIRRLKFGGAYVYKLNDNTGVEE